MAYQGFDDKKVAAALEAARGYHDLQALSAPGANIDPYDDGHLNLAAECVSVKVEDGKVCLSLPLGIGDVCLPIPSFIPSGTLAEACLSICTTWGIPTGVRVTVSVAGKVIVTKTFLKC